jgi:hypothetical protein
MGLISQSNPFGFFPCLFGGGGGGTNKKKGVYLGLFAGFCGSGEGYL